MSFAVYESEIVERIFIIIALNNFLRYGFIFIYFFIININRVKMNTNHNIKLLLNFLFHVIYNVVDMNNILI